ncbi:MAG: ABC transporter permease [Candidatus Hydrothermales bacterium]
MAIAKFFLSAFLLALKVESNWTRPFWFLFYHAIKPFSSVILVLFMYKAVLGFDFKNPFFPFIYVGTVFWTFVQSSTLGISWSILSDREFYETLKYMIILPYSYVLNLFGRFFAYFILSLFSVTILLISGKLLFTINFSLKILFIIYFISSIPLFFSTGLLFGSLLLLYPRYAFFLQEFFTSALFLISGVVFPVKLLPFPLNLIASYSPITIWLDGIRKNLGINFLSQNTFDPNKLLINFLILSFLFFILSIKIFNITEQLARRKGKIEETTGG